MISKGNITNCDFKIQNHSFQYDFKVLPLKGYDIVLGVKWLKFHGPNFTEWEKKCISVTIGGKWVTIMDRAAQPEVISAKAY